LRLQNYTFFSYFAKKVKKNLRKSEKKCIFARYLRVRALRAPYKLGGMKNEYLPQITQITLKYQNNTNYHQSVTN